jgi:aflatoxin B1 aldehyde reductase
MAPAHPIIVFGTGNVGISWGGPATTEEGLPGTLDALGRLGITRIDTAAAYPALGEKGLAERILGRAGVGSHPAGFEVDTKIFVSLDARAGSLSAAKVRESAAESVARLGVGCVNVLYCHWPDDETPLEEQVEALEEQRREGRCKQVSFAKNVFLIPPQWQN